MIGIDDIRAAAERLRGVAIHTPLINNDAIDELAGGPVYLKPECLQRTGSFKIRGAYNRLSQLTRAEAARGVVAFSSGNHAQGVAEAGRRLGIKTTIVMPDDAPQVKLDNTRALGADIVLYDRFNEDREAIAAELAAETGSPVVPSYDHPQIMAGQGTAGMEIADDLEALGLQAERLLVCCGGGGLGSGIGTALRAAFPALEVYTVEPEGFDDTARSLEAGERIANAPGAESICDAILTPMPGETTFRQLTAMGARGLVVSDDDVREAMRVAFRELKLVVEPGGAVALAAAISGKLPPTDGISVVILSGGNVDPAAFSAIQRGSSRGA